MCASSNLNWLFAIRLIAVRPGSQPGSPKDAHARVLHRVTEGTRTPDLQGHNLAL